MPDEIEQNQLDSQPKENIGEILEEVKKEIIEKPKIEVKEESTKPETLFSDTKKVEEDIEAPMEPKEPAPIKNNKKDMISYIAIGVLILVAVVLAILDYPRISVYWQKQRNPYGFNYNFEKVRAFDWDTMLTEKKVAKALSVPLQKINSAKNPDYSWILEEPKQFVEEIKCASLIDEKI